MDTTIGNMVEAYLLNIKYKKFKKTAVKNLFLGSNKVLKEERDFVFLNQDNLSAKMKITDKDIAECIIEAVKSSLKLYPKNKKAAIDIYKDFLNFIDKNYNLKITMAFPEWLPTNTLERQLHIVKLLHDPKIEVSTIQGMLYVGEKTIESDLKKLQGKDEDPLEVLGQKLVIDFDRKSRHFPSTVHPLFLTFNLTQVITTLEGLKKMSEDSAHKNYALNAARTIWAQLSDYATRRIFTVSEGLGLDVRWYQSLESGEKNLFYSEPMCSTSVGCESVLYCYKNSKPCLIEYLEEDERTVYYKNCLIKIHDYHNNTLIIEMNGKELQLDIDRVLKAAPTEHELY
ncbi:MAG: hypothetical protein WA113_10885 [Desulfitobacteriaceae bacterium]